MYLREIYRISRGHLDYIDSKYPKYSALKGISLNRQKINIQKIKDLIFSEK